MIPWSSTTSRCIRRCSIILTMAYRLKILVGPSWRRRTTWSCEFAFRSLHQLIIGCYRLIRNRSRTAAVRQLVPKEQLACFSLEDDFGWKQICPVVGKTQSCGYLGRYPRGNAPKEFQQLTMRLLGPSFAKAAAGVITAVLIPAGVIALYIFR